MKVLSAVISILFLAFSIIILAYALIDIKPYYKRDDGFSFGLLDLEKGIPVSVKFTQTIFDTLFYSKDATGNSIRELVYQGSGNKVRYGIDPISLSDSAYRDTLFTKYNLMPVSLADRSRLQLNGSKIMNGYLYINTKDLWLRLLLLSPIYLGGFLIAFSVWQTGKLLDNILRGDSFTVENYKGLQNIGNGIIIYQVFLILLDLFMGVTVGIYFYSTRANNYYLLNFTAYSQYGWSIYWILLGCISKVLGIAFKKGYQLQQVQG